MDLEKNHKDYLESAPEFKRLFGAKLKQFWDPVTRFDILHFEQFIGEPPEGVSLKDKVEKAYGEEAVKLILRLF